MKIYLYISIVLLLFAGCTKSPKIVEIQPDLETENYQEVLSLFQKNCETKKAKKIYADLCEKSLYVDDAKKFFTQNFKPSLVVSKDGDTEGLLTGYYEASIKGSYKRSDIYKYPIYKTPNDLIVVDLSKIYPELKSYRLRGRIKGNKLIPYSSREEVKKKEIDADVICYTDSKVDRFFLEVQGSGIVELDDNTSIYIGYANQNGHKYRSVGRYLVKHNEIPLKDISLQSIKKWLKENPDRVDEVLNYNDSMVFFQKRSQGATGALGLELTPKRSVAVDPKYIPLGSMLFIDSKVDGKSFKKIVFAQDTGGAIKGAIRADLFVGSGDEAMRIAGELKSKLSMWILKPKEEGTYGK